MGRIVLTDDGITLYDSGVASSAPIVAPPAPPPANPSPLAPSGNVTDLLFAPHHDVGPSGGEAPASGPVLDFNVVGGGIPINLTGPKTIINCPAHVVVTVVQASGQSGAHNSYTVVVNGNSTFMPNVQSEYVSSNYGLDITGPNVVVSVDSPGLQMQIRAV
jgi:hypothetical protein